MIRVVVLEDKQPILKNIIKKIENFSPELIVVGEGTDGIVGQALIEKLKPDIVFTDIRMPGQDGLQLIKIEKEKFPDTLFVIISGYDEFEYAKTALKLGVEDYLLKPITQLAMDETLNMLVKQVKNNRYIKEQKLISKLLMSPEKVKNLNLEYNYYMIVNVIYGSYASFFIDLYNTTSYTERRSNIYSILAEGLSVDDNIWKIDTDAINEEIYVIGFKNKPEKIDNIFNSDLFTKNSDYGIPITLGYSGIVKDITLLKLEYQMLLTIMRKKLIFGESSIINGSCLNLTAKVSTIYDSSMEKAIKQHIKNGEKSKLLIQIYKYLDSCKEKRVYQSVLENELKQIMSDLSKTMVNKESDYGDIYLEIEEVISKATCYEELYLYITSIIERFFEKVDFGNISSKKIANLMKNYLISHYSEEVNINDLAEMLNFNISYLSRVFKKHFDYTPVEYLTYLRIEKAKKLLEEDKKMKIKAIAEMVGYSNQYYFCKVFKVMTMVTPTEYRENIS